MGLNRSDTLHGRDLLQGRNQNLMKILNRYSDQIYSLMRLVAGFLYACHGAQKLFGVLGGARELHDPLMLIAGIIEFGGGVLIALGLFTTIAAFVASGEMAVAYFRAHAPHGFWPIRNPGELAGFVCFLFFYFPFPGDTRWKPRRLIQRKPIQPIITPGRRTPPSES